MISKNFVWWIVSVLLLIGAVLLAINELILASLCWVAMFIFSADRYRYFRVRGE